MRNSTGRSRHQFAVHVRMTVYSTVFVSTVLILHKVHATICVVDCPPHVYCRSTKHPTLKLENRPCRRLRRMPLTPIKTRAFICRVTERGSRSMHTQVAVGPVFQKIPYSVWALKDVQ